MRISGIKFDSFASKQSFVPIKITFHFWIFLILLSTHVRAQKQQMELLGASEGLSQGMIYDLLQDKKGFIWLATRDGLNRYDGYTFQTYLNDPFDPFTIADNEVESLHEDHLGRIWAGTMNNGLSVFYPPTGKFHHIRKGYSPHIACLTETTDGSIWAGSNNGLKRFKIPDQFPQNTPLLDEYCTLDTIEWDSLEASNHAWRNHIVDILGASDGKLWVSSFLSIGYYDLHNQQIKKVWVSPPLKNGLYTSSFLEQAPNGDIWIGQAGQLLRYRNGQLDKFLLPEVSSFPMTKMAFDASGKLFICTRKQIYILSNPQVEDPTQAHFRLFYRFPENNSLGSTVICRDLTGLMWIGTNGYGVYKYNPGNHHFQHYLSGKSPRKIVLDRRGQLWVWQQQGAFYPLNKTDDALGATSILNDRAWIEHDLIQTPDLKYWIMAEKRQEGSTSGVLFRYSSEHKMEARFEIPVAIGMFSSFHLQPNGTFLILGNQSNLVRFDPVQKQFTVADFSETTGFRELAIALLTDTAGDTWIGTPHGLVKGRQEADKYTFSLFRNNPNQHTSLNCNYVLCLLDDPVLPNQYLWIGTKGGGLSKMDKITGHCVHFTAENGLPNNVVYGILAEENAGLWLSTNRGLSRFDLKSGDFQHYFAVDGLQDNEFNTLSFTKGTDGQLYFGGVNGISTFYPDRIRASRKNVPLHLTRLKINNEIANQRNGLLPYDLQETRSITLNHTQNQLTFEFAAVDFASPQMNQFRYRLRGADKDWVESTTHMATYVHLPPGHYVFEVFSGGSRGIWDDTSTQLEIIILPPWWRTNWAYLLFFAIFSGLIWGFYRFQMGKVRLANKLIFEQREAQRLAALDTLKTNFFNSVTHEFRTPLTLLLEPARQLLSEVKEASVRYRLQLIENSGRRLLQFVNQLLDLSKLEADHMPIELQPGDPGQLLRSVVARFEPLMEQQGIQWKWNTPDKPIRVYFNAEMWEQVLSNLLANALKFTDKGGKVQVTLEEKKNPDAGHTSLHLTVSDTGTGIPANELPRIFDRFYQTEHIRGGSGIGLALCKEWVERLGGQISVQSVVGTGSKFSVTLPCTKVEGVVPISVRRADSDPLPGRITPILSSPIQQGNAPLLLLIEDDAQLRHFLRASLPAHYRISEACNGAEGIEMARELIPDLVISDLVMPLKNGYEVVETLKSSPETSHIPIILLTAKSALESKVMGLQRGADVYLTKPFRADEVVAHIENLLDSRRRLQAYFSQPPTERILTKEVEQAISGPEQMFLAQLQAIIESNLDNEAMDAEAYARAMFVSRSQLHRKITAITGLSISEYVRNHRLDRAQEMLLAQEGNVFDVAGRTGFSNAKYFSTCFKERFGVSPSSYLRS